MELTYRIQPFQTDAMQAIVDVFEGQPKADPLGYLRELGAPTSDRAGTLAGINTASTIGYGNAPVMVYPQMLLKNIQRIQALHQIPESAELAAEVGACQLDIEMETGTGKTYVYTKAMFELNRQYGWTKFIIVVPSVAIREGVYKSLESTRDHFTSSTASCWTFSSTIPRTCGGWTTLRRAPTSR